MQNYTQQPSVSRVIPPSRKINKCVGIEEFLQRSKQPNFSMRVAQLGKGDTVTPDKEDSKVTEGAPELQVDKAHINVKQNRKLNRICGALNPDVYHPIEPVRQSLFTVISQINQGKKIDDTLQGHLTGLMCASIDVAVSESINPMQYDMVVIMAPLSYWLNYPEPADIGVLFRLRTLRLQMAQRDRLSIIAHRGMGATNRSFGGLIRDDDPARQRPIENSPFAFDTALQNAASQSNPEGIDGIECDVFLSQDGVPIVSHDSNIYDQMTAARRALFLASGKNRGTKIKDMRASDLIKSSRSDLVGGRDDLGTAFLPLDVLLFKVLPAAKAYTDLCGKAFRFEIEMKGMKEDEDLVTATAKSVNRFKKTFPKSECLEIIMFNGTPQDILRFAETRVQKTRMGGMLVGLGKSPLEQAVGAIDEDRSKVVPSSLIDITHNRILLPSVQSRETMVWDIDEYRESLALRNKEDPLLSSPDYIRTYVLPAEMPLFNPEGKVQCLEFSRKDIDCYLPLFKTCLDKSDPSDLFKKVCADADELRADADQLIKDADRLIEDDQYDQLDVAAIYFRLKMHASELEAKAERLVKGVEWRWNIEYGRRHYIGDFDSQLGELIESRTVHVLTDFPERVGETRARLQSSALSVKS